ncbi:MAG: ATPase, T2SS/T4P/T4SS family [Planctomycetota bacterium]
MPRAPAAGLDQDRPTLDRPTAETTTMPTAALPDATHALTLAQALVLVSWWKPILLLIPVIAWAWFVSKIFDKHAARFSLPRKQWNLVHLLVATVAVLGAFILPIPGIAGVLAAFGLLVVVLAADILIFLSMHNKDDRVPEGHELRLDLSSIKEAREAKAAAKQAGTVQLKILDAAKNTAPVPDRETPEFEQRVASETLVITAVDARARTLDITPIDKEGNYAITMQVDGVRQPIEKLPGAAAVKHIDFWKTCAGLDVSDRRKKQTGEITVSQGEAWHKPIRLETIGGGVGPKLTMLFEPAKQVTRPLDELGLLPAQTEAFEAIRDEPGGLVLVAAAPANGLTTSIYAMIGQHDPYTKIVQTVETDVQASLEGANQNVYDPTGDGEYSTLVRSILRRDPDFVLVADLPDASTAQEAVGGDLKRSRVYVGLRAENAMHALQGFVKLHGSTKDVGGVVKGVVAQKLCRRLCQNCRVPYQPQPELLKKLGLPADRVKQLYKKGGQVLIKNKPEVCPVCGGSGYFGQIALFEIYPIGDAERDLIAAGDWNGVKAELRKRKLPTIQQSGLRRAVEGLTSLEEVTRVTSPPKKK